MKALGEEVVVSFGRTCAQDEDETPRGPLASLTVLGKRFRWARGAVSEPLLHPAPVQPHDGCPSPPDPPSFRGAQPPGLRWKEALGLGGKSLSTQHLQRGRGLGVIRLLQRYDPLSQLSP